MLVFNNQVALKEHLKLNFSSKKLIGFVPTMGALHNGHLSLIDKSIKQNDVTVVSIFVNPTQFNNISDLEKYPRTLESDVAKINTIDNNVLIYAPSNEDIYQENISSEHFDFDGLEFQMEGKFRNGHFDGVGTIVKRLFEIVKPNNAYFGEKDFQQLQIVKKLTTKHNLNVNVIACEIFREDNGLAMSSRNERLTSEERSKASIIYETLKEVKVKFGTENVSDIYKWVEQVFNNQKLFELEYFEIASETSLLPYNEELKEDKYRAFIAVFVNNIRLIDTISLN